MGKDSEILYDENGYIIPDEGLEYCCYPDCFHCPYPDCVSDEIHPGELRMNGECSGLPKMLLSDTRLRLWNSDTMKEGEE